MSSTAAVRRTRLGGLLWVTARAAGRVPRPMLRPLTRPLAALTAPMRVPLAIVGAPLGRATALDRPVVALRHSGRDVTPGELADLLRGSDAGSGRLLVLVPEPGADERQWERGRAETGATYAERLQHLLDWTPVHVRLDPGPAADSGLELAALLQRLVDAWPVPVRRLVLVTAGTGGLAVRAACATRVLGGPPWIRYLTEVVGLGVPRYAAEPSRLASDLGKRLDEQLAGIVVAEPAYLGLEPVVAVEHLLVSEQPPWGARPVGSALGRMLWWRHRRGGGQRHVVDLFPAAETFELPAGGPLTNRGEVHDALLRWLA